jgi:hypothetical protein
MTELDMPRATRRRRARIAIGLWLLLAMIVFNVRFDWQTRVAGHVFVQSQLARQHQGQPAISINDGFRPMVRDAAVEAALWFAIIAAFGAVSIVTAARGSR